MNNENGYYESVYERVKNRRRAVARTLNEACDAAVELREEDGKEVTIYNTPPNDAGDTEEDSAGE